jgi:excisionase family DNA binding protein
LLKVAEKTVYGTAQKRQLSAFKVGGQRRVQRVDIDRWIEQQKANAGDREGAEMATACHGTSFNPLEAGLGLRRVACRIGDLSQ